MTSRKTGAKKSLHFLIGLDYDGTLTPIVRDPGRAILSPAAREILRRLAREKSCTLAIISGRKLSEIKKLVGLRGIVYGGNHGIEMAGDGWKYLHPAAAGARPAIRKIAAALKRRLETVPGTSLEDKGASLSVHFRRAKKKDIGLTLKTVEDTIEPYRKRKQIKITSGKKVVEIRPPEKWDKGAALLWLRDRIRREKGAGVFPVFIGDDVTDESAFAAIGKKGLSVKVGGDGQKTRARYRLNGIPRVRQLLKHLSHGKWELITRPENHSVFTPASTSRS